MTAALVVAQLAAPCLGNAAAAGNVVAGLQTGAFQDTAQITQVRDIGFAGALILLIVATFFLHGAIAGSLVVGDPKSGTKRRLPWHTRLLCLALSLGLGAWAVLDVMARFHWRL